jgi:hypothetical protein
MAPTKLPNNNSELKISFYKKLCRKKWFKILRPFIFIALVVLVIYILTVIGIFKIKEFRVENELLYVNNLNEISEKYKGTAYFSLDLEQLETDIKKSNRYVKDVSTAKIFPNKISVNIEEYQPTYYLELKEVCYILSQEGLVVEENTEYEECSLENGIKLESKENILAENKLIFDLELYQVVKILNEFGWEISNVEFQKNVMLVSDADRVLTIEVNQEYEEQLYKLYLVLEKANIEGIEYSSLDLRYQRPVMELQ